MTLRLTSLALAILALAFALVAASAFTAHGQTPPPGRQKVLTMTCMVGGQPHRLDARIEALEAAGLSMPKSGIGGRVIPIGQYTYYYEGTVRGPLGTFHFSGENSFGQFYGPRGGETRAQFDMIGEGRLMITLDPFGTPQRVMCRG
ncbi:MAG: hypothetical protein AAF577_12910 [Pseudomonadota bacterium]